jgi:hypothetical protein
MALFGNGKKSPTLAKLRELFQAEEEEKQMRVAARWVPQLADALTEFDRTLEDVKRVNGVIYSATQKSNQVLWQLGIVMKRRLDKDSRGVVRRDNVWRLMAMSGARDQYVAGLHEQGLKAEDSYLAAIYELAKAAEGISAEDAQARADAAAAKVQQILSELESWDAKEVTMRSVTLQDGRRSVSPFFTFAPDILAGDGPTLLEWARQNVSVVREG